MLHIVPDVFPCIIQVTILIQMHRVDKIFGVHKSYAYPMPILGSSSRLADINGKKQIRLFAMLHQTWLIMDLTSD